MSRVIKYHSEEERILQYVRDQQEELSTDESSGGLFTDPTAILAEARAEAEHKVQEAYAEGMRRGEAAGEAQFSESVGEAAAMLDGIAQALEERRETFLKSMEDQVVALCEMVSAKILERELATDSSIVREMVHRVLARLAMEERVRVHVNPNDLQAVMEVKPELEAHFARIAQIEIFPDASIESGGCVAESDRLHVDAQLSSQLIEVISAMRTVDSNADESESAPSAGVDILDTAISEAVIEEITESEVESEAATQSVSDAPVDVVEAEAPDEPEIEAEEHD